jgi:hypothetical protein
MGRMETGGDRNGAHPRFDRLEHASYYVPIGGAGVKS